MIVATPSGWTRQTFSLADAGGAGAPFGEMDFRIFGGGRLTVGADDFDLGARATGTRYELQDHRAQTVATAIRTRVFRRRYDVSTDRLDVELVARGWLSNRWEVAEHGAPVGEARWSGEIRSRLRASFPEHLPLVLQSFLVAVMLAERRRRGNG